MSMRLLYILFGLTIVLVLIVIFVAFHSFQPSESGVTEPTPGQTSQLLTITPSKDAQTIPAVPYVSGTFQKDVDRLQNRKPLDSGDAEVKSQVLSHIGNKSGDVYTSANIKLHYVAAPDDLEGEIFTTDLTGAKKEAEEWLKTQGFSQQGICRFPVTFYINSSTASQLRNTKIQFSPIPNGC